MSPLTFSAPLVRDADGTWWYIKVPEDVRRALKSHERRGVIPITATVGRTTWEASLLPWADGCAQLNINRRLREAEELLLGQAVTATISAR